MTKRRGPYYFHDDVCVKPLLVEHLSLLLEHRNEYSTWRNLNDVSPLSEASQSSWFSKVSNDGAKQYFIAYRYEVHHGVAVEETPIGFIRIDEIDFVNKSARIGCDIFSESRGQGFGTKIMELAKGYCIKELNMNRLWLLVIEDNEAAKKTYENSGFIKEGVQREAIYRDGHYHNYIMMSYIRELDP